MAKKKSTTNKANQLLIFLLIILLLLILANIIFFKWRTHPPKQPAKPLSKVKISIIIDDLGYQDNYGEMLYEISPRITLAILPHQPYSRQIAAKAHARGQEIIIHLPMEPYHYEKQGQMPNTLLVNMTAMELRNMLIYNLEDLPQASGINNHMGSLMTEQEDKMNIILTELKQRGLFFIDSRTISHSKAYALAKQLGVKTAQRDIFLDNDDNIKSITSQLIKLVRLAKQNGKAIAIGHARPKTISALKAFWRTELAQQVQLVSASVLLE